MLSDRDILAVLREELADAEQYIDVLIGEERAKALDYYLGRPMGDEREGRSRVISREVYKTVEGISTAIANIYATAKNAIEFVPRRAEDVQGAEQRTAGVGYVFYGQNNGFLSLIEAIKDGVLSKAGFLTWRWERQRLLTQERYRDQTPIQLALLTQDNPGIEVVEHRQKGIDQHGQPVFDVVVNVLNTSGRAIVEAVPPEEVLVSTRTRSADIQQAPCVIWRSQKTRTELLMCGYDPAIVDMLAFTHGRTDHTLTRARDEAHDTAHGEARIYTAWIKHDCDGDGIVELRKVVWSDDTIVDNSITDAIELSSWSPIIAPHEFIGRCPADDSTDTQEVMTVGKRQILDNLYIANNPMWRVDPTDSRVNIDDFYAPEIGRPLRAPKDGADVVMFPFVAQHTYPLLEYEQADNENKTGFTRYSQGLDAQALNKTARGVSILTNMSQQRVQLMARIFGELCLKPALRGLAKLLAQHGDKQLIFRLNGSYVTVDPREWQEEFDMTVNVGLGTTDKDQQLMHLQTIAAAQQAAVQAGGLGRLLTEKNIYNVQAKIAENAGFKDPSFAWLDPDTASPPQPQPKPEDIKVQADLQQTQMQIESNERIKAMELEHDARKTTFQAESGMQTEHFRAGAKANERAAVDATRNDGEQRAMAATQQAFHTVQHAVAALGEQMASGFLQLQQVQIAMLQAIRAPKKVVRGADNRISGVIIDDEEPGMGVMQ